MPNADAGCQMPGIRNGPALEGIHFLYDKISFCFPKGNVMKLNKPEKSFKMYAATYKISEKYETRRVRELQVPRPR